MLRFPAFGTQPEVQGARKRACQLPVALVSMGFSTSGLVSDEQKEMNEKGVSGAKACQEPPATSTMRLRAATSTCSHGSEELRLAT